MSFYRQDLDLVRFESGDGAIAAGTGAVVWERKDFLGPDFFLASIVEGRNLFTSLMQLLEIGPLVSLLFLLATVAVISARQQLTVVQILTLSAAYAVYFPLILYLSSRFLVRGGAGDRRAGAGRVAGTTTPAGCWGRELGPAGRTSSSCCFTRCSRRWLCLLAGTAAWCCYALGVVTLGVLINLQNRALRRQSVVRTAAGLPDGWPPRHCG